MPVQSTPELDHDAPLRPRGEPTRTGQTATGALCAALVRSAFAFYAWDLPEGSRANVRDECGADRGGPTANELASRSADPRARDQVGPKSRRPRVLLAVRTLERA